MRFKYCPDCGAALAARDLGDDLQVPWCERCDKPWFDVFPTCVISLVYNGDGEVLLLHQGYISHQYANLVSGYMTPGESAEEAAVREIHEETGLEVVDLESAGTYWFQRKEMLMIGFLARVRDGQPVRTSSEVDRAEWVKAEAAPGLVHPFGSVSHTLCDLYLKRKSKKVYHNGPSGPSAD